MFKGGLNTVEGGSFDAWKYDPEGDASTNSSRNNELPAGIHEALTRRTDVDIHYYILRKDLETNNRYITIDEANTATGYNNGRWETFVINKNDRLQVIGVLLIEDKSNYLPEDPKYMYLFATSSYSYIILHVDSYEAKSFPRSIKRLFGSSAAAGGGSSASAAGGGSSSAAPAGEFRTPNSFSSAAPPPLTGTFGGTPTPPRTFTFGPITGASLTYNPFVIKRGGARNPKKICKKKGSKSRKQQKKAKSRKSRKQQKSRKRH